MTRFSYESGSFQLVVVSVLTLALLAALGYIFWQNITAYDEVQPEKQSADSKTAKVVAAERYEGQRYTSLGGAYSLKVPNGWKLINNTDDSSINDSFDKNYLTTGPGLDGKLTYDAATPPLINKSELGGWGGFAELFTVSVLPALPEDAVKGDDFKTDEGLIGKKSEVVTPARPDVEVYATTDDFYSYSYLFEKNETIVQVQFDIFANNRQGYGTIIDDVVRTLEVL